MTLSIFEHQDTGAEWSICKLSKHQKTGGDDIQIERTRMEFHSMPVSDYRYLEKCSRVCSKKTESRRRGTSIQLENHVFIWDYLCRQR